MKQKKHRRIARTIVQKFPTRCMFEVENDIRRYSETANGVDWEGHRAMFRRLIRISIKERHK